MTEIFSNISEDTRQIAEFFWDLSMTKHTLPEKVTVLDNITRIYSIFGTQEEVEFLQFYFRMRMEMMKND